MYQAHRVLVKVTDDLRPKLRTHGQRDLGATRATPPQLRRVDVIVEEQAWVFSSSFVPSITRIFSGIFFYNLNFTQETEGWNNHKD